MPPERREEKQDEGREALELGAGLLSEETRPFAVNNILQNLLPHAADHSLASRLVQQILGGEVRRFTLQGLLGGKKTLEFPQPSWEEIQHILTYLMEQECVMRFATSPSGNFLLVRLLESVFENFPEENNALYRIDVVQAIASQIPNLYDLALNRFGYKLAVRIVTFAWGSQSLVHRVKEELLNPSVMKIWQKARQKSELMSYKERAKIYLSGYYFCLKAVITVSHGQAIVVTEKERQLAATTLREVLGPDIESALGPDIEFLPSESFLKMVAPFKKPGLQPLNKPPCSAWCRDRRSTRVA